MLGRLGVNIEPLVLLFHPGTMHRLTYMNGGQAKRNFLYGAFLSLIVARAGYSEPLYVTKDGPPNTYSQATQENAYRSLGALVDPNTDFRYITPASLMSASAVTHDAQVRTRGNPISLKRHVLPPVRTQDAPAALPEDLSPQRVNALDNPTAIKTRAINMMFVRSCRQITSPGTYVLLEDLTSSGSCLTVSGVQGMVNNVAGVTIDCLGHTISSGNSAAISVNNSSQVTIRNCNLTNDNATFALRVTNSQAVTLSSSTVRQVIFDHVQDAQITNNHILGTYLQKYTSGSLIADNVIDQMSLLGVGIYLSYGENNRVLRNHIDGGYDSNLDTWGKQGADNGIILQAENNDLVQGNDLQNFFNAGIEGSDKVSNTLIEGNRIRNAGIAGITQFYGTSWLNNTVRGNSVFQSPALFMFTYTKSGAAIAPAGFYFQNNVFESNTLRSTVLGPGKMVWPASTFDLVYPPELNAILGNNLIRNNDFGTQTPGPVLNPRAAFIDGGGNTCSGVGTSLACINRPNAIRRLFIPEATSISPRFLPPPQVLPSSLDY